MNDKPETEEVTCPKCGDKTERYTASLEVFIVGCPKCGCRWKHERLVLREMMESLPKGEN